MTLNRYPLPFPSFRLVQVFSPPFISVGPSVPAVSTVILGLGNLYILYANSMKMNDASFVALTRANMYHLKKEAFI